MMPSVTILLPVYNHAAFLKRSLAALTSQTSPPDEVIVIDDGSTDASFEVATGLAAGFGSGVRYRVLRNEANQGVNRTLNRGLAAAGGDWVVCTGADDWLRPRFVEAMSEAAERFPEVCIITSQYVEHYEAEDRTVEHGPDSEDGLWYSDQDLRFFGVADLAKLLRRCHIGLHFNSSIIRAEALRSIGGLDPALKWHADWFAIYSLALRHGFAVVADPLAVFRRAADSYSGANVGLARRQRQVCNALLDKLKEPQWQDVRERLASTPAPFSPFVRHLVPALIYRPNDWDLLAHVAIWWLNDARKGRRPGPNRRLAQRLGFDTAP